MTAIFGVCLGFLLFLYSVLQLAVLRGPSPREVVEPFQALLRACGEGAQSGKLGKMLGALGVELKAPRKKEERERRNF